MKGSRHIKPEKQLISAPFHIDRGVRRSILYLPDIPDGIPVLLKLLGLIGGDPGEIRLIIGKGGMGDGTMRGCREYKAIHCVFPAGCAVVAAACVEEIIDAQWKDLGMPETLWTSQVKAFGPLIVSIDTHGRNLFEENKVLFNKRKEAVYEEICREVKFIK